MSIALTPTVWGSQRIKFHPRRGRPRIEVSSPAVARRWAVVSELIKGRQMSRREAARELGMTHTTVRRLLLREPRPLAEVLQAHHPELPITPFTADVEGDQVQVWTLLERIAVVGPCGQAQEAARHQGQLRVMPINRLRVGPTLRWRPPTRGELPEWYGSLRPVKRPGRRPVGRTPRNEFT